MRQSPRQKPDSLKESKNTFDPRRRRLLEALGAGAALAALPVPAAAAALSVLPIPALSEQDKKRNEERRKEQEEKRLKENIGREKEEVRKDTAHGKEQPREFKTWLLRYNASKKESEHFDIGSKAYDKAEEATDTLFKEGLGFFMKRGTFGLEPFIAADESAEQLLENDAAITALATARVLYRERAIKDGASNKKLPYWHNLAAAYVELGDESPERIVEKLDDLFAYTSSNKIDFSIIPAELIMYYLIDDGFNLSLTPDALEAVLNRDFPTWQQPRPASRDYAHYNELSALDIFELNRLEAVISHLDNPDFVSDVFEYRDQNVEDTHTGRGGVIPLANPEHHLQNIPVDEEDDNNAGVTAGKLSVEMLASAATFRFNATVMEEPPENHGPSEDEYALFAPAVVFSSIDDSTILVHFYTSIVIEGDGNKQFVKNAVVCLGVIKRPALPSHEEEDSNPDSTMLT